jgi:hypothetical protein
MYVNHEAHAQIQQQQKSDQTKILQLYLEGGESWLKELPWEHVFEEILL